MRLSPSATAKWLNGHMKRAGIDKNTTLQLAIMDVADLKISTSLIHGWVNENRAIQQNHAVALTQVFLRQHLARGNCLDDFVPFPSPPSAEAVLLGAASEALQTIAAAANQAGAPTIWDVACLIAMCSRNWLSVKHHLSSSTDKGRANDYAIRVVTSATEFCKQLNIPLDPASSQRALVDLLELERRWGQHWIAVCTCLFGSMPRAAG